MARVAGVVVGLMLVSAAALKGYELAATGGTAGPLALPRWAWSGWIVFEWALGWLLIAGLLPRLSRVIAGAAFIIFAALSLMQAIDRAGSCGCFGVVAVDPRFTLGLDVIAAAAMFLLWPRAQRAASSRPRMVVAGLIVASAAAWPALILSGPHRSWPVPAAVVARSRYLQPHEWLNKPLPLLGELNPAGRLESGPWIVLIYRGRCRHCAIATPRYIEMAKQAATRPSSPRVALLELPPYEPRDPLPQDGPPLWRLRLSDPTPWIGRTPVEIRLDGGRVTSVEIIPAPPDAPATMPADDAAMP